MTPYIHQETDAEYARRFVNDVCDLHFVYPSIPTHVFGLPLGDVVTIRMHLMKLRMTTSDLITLLDSMYAEAINES